MLQQGSPLVTANWIVQVITLDVHKDNQLKKKIEAYIMDQLQECQQPNNSGSEAGRFRNREDERRRGWQKAGVTHVTQA